jgi:hypothetical protein
MLATMWGSEMAGDTKTDNAMHTVLERSYEILEALQRHVVVGLFLLPMWYFSFSERFKAFDFKEPSWGFIVLMAVLALMLGNIWYAVHRYVVHPFIDWLAFVYWKSKHGLCCNDDINARTCLCKACTNSYTVWLARHLLKSSDCDLDYVKSYIAYRASLINVVYITGEALVVFAMFADNNTWIGQNHKAVALFGGVIFFLAWLQHFCTFQVDSIVTQCAYLHEQRGKDKKTALSFTLQVDEKVQS